MIKNIHFLIGLIIFLFYDYYLWNLLNYIIDNFECILIVCLFGLISLCRWKTFPHIGERTVNIFQLVDFISYFKWIPHFGFFIIVSGKRKPRFRIILFLGFPKAVLKLFHPYILLNKFQLNEGHTTSVGFFYKISSLIS